MNTRILTTVVLAFCCAGIEAQAPNKFRINVGVTVQGAEEFTIQSTTDGYTASCKGSLNLPNGISNTEETTKYSRDWEPLDYRLSANTSAGRQSVEMLASDKGFVVKAQAGGQDYNKTLESRPRAVVLDNLVACHQQALLKRFALHRPGDDQFWWLLVPQVLQAVEMQITADGEADGLLNGKPVHLLKIHLKAGSVQEELLADAATLDLESVVVASQGLKMVREGFKLPKETSSLWNERDITFPSAGLAMPGTLCVPAKGKHFPVVVLVHGSGPHDRDETIGPNHTFRDIAHGLAAQGIATLRYDKRTKAFPASFADGKVTLDNEVIDDAVAALEFVAKQKEIDPRRMVLLGHSLGGFAAPLIAARVPALAGVILLAAPGRDLCDMVNEQATFQITKVAGRGEDDPGLKSVRDNIARVRSGEMPDAEKFMGAPASYWRDLSKATPLELEALKKLPNPVLVLQGGKDVQVRRTDYDIILATLAAKPEALRQAHFFPNLNHLFQPVEGDPTGAEYSKAVPMAQEAIDVMGKWIIALAPAL